MFTEYSFAVQAGVGVHRVTAVFLNDKAVPDPKDPKVFLEDRNLYVSRIVIVSPAGVPDPTRSDADAWAASA